MKGVKGRFLNKLKFVPTINTLKQGLAIRRSSLKCQTLPIYTDEDHGCNDIAELVVDSIGVSGRVKELKDEEPELGFNLGDEENFSPPIESKDRLPGKDNPKVAVQEMEKDSQESPFLKGYEEKCPPGGEDSVIFYTTSLRGIRKTFEDCRTIRFLLQSFKVTFYERDVSLHMEFRDELWSSLSGRVIPPRLFIKGRYIGGADEVVGLHEQGKLKKLLEGIPRNLSDCSCNGCGNIRFVLCSNCSGSCKVFRDGDDDDDDELHIRCPECNENGLVKCPICS